MNSSQGSVASSQKLIDRVREAAKALQGERGLAGTFGGDDLADRLGIQTFADKDKLRRRQILPLIKRGELLRVKTGQFRWRGQTGPPNRKEVMWRVLRARKVVTITDLQELAGASREYAQEFMGRLEKQGVVQRLTAPAGANHPDKFRLVSDPGPELPRDEDKAAYLRRRREQKKAALAKLDEVYAGALEVMQKAAAARLAVSALEES